MIFLASVLSSYPWVWYTQQHNWEPGRSTVGRRDVLPSIDTQAVRGKRRRNAWFRNRGGQTGLQGLKEALWYTNKKIHHCSWGNLAWWRKTSISFLVSHGVSVPHNVYLATEARIFRGRFWVLNFLNAVDDIRKQVCRSPQHMQIDKKVAGAILQKHKVQKKKKFFWKIQTKIS